MRENFFEDKNTEKKKNIHDSKEKNVLEKKNEFLFD